MSGLPSAMDNLNHPWRWRRSAKIIGFLDTGMLGLATFLEVQVLLLQWLAIQQNKIQYNNNELILGTPPTPRAEDARTTFVIVFGVMFHFFELWAALKLLRSTELKTDAREAIRMCKIWQIVKFIDIALTGIIIVCLAVAGTDKQEDYFSGLVTATGMIIMLEVDIIINCIFLGVVYLFVQELRNFIQEYVSAA